jgi:hypothetical protein
MPETGSDLVSVPPSSLLLFRLHRDSGGITYVQLWDEQRNVLLLLLSFLSETSSP